MVAFFPPVSADNSASGRFSSKFSAVCVPPVKMMASTSACPESVWIGSPSSQVTSCNASLGIPASQKQFAISTPKGKASGDGLNRTVFPQANAAATPPVGIAIGKFHGGITKTTPSGDNFSEVCFSSKLSE